MPEYHPYGIPYGIPIHPVVLSAAVPAENTFLAYTQPLPLNFYITAFTFNARTLGIIYVFIGPPGQTTFDDLTHNCKPLFRYVPIFGAGCVFNGTAFLPGFRSGPYPKGSCIYAWMVNQTQDQQWETALFGVELVDIVQEYPEQPK